MCILMQGFPPSDVDLTNANEGLVMLLPNFFYPKFAMTANFRYEVSKQFRRQLFTWATGRSPNCLPPTWVTTVCIAGVLRRG